MKTRNENRDGRTGEYAHCVVLALAAPARADRVEAEAPYAHEDGDCEGFRKAKKAAR